MKKLIWVICLAISTSVSAKDMFEKKEPVTQNSPTIVKDYSSGVCSIGRNKSGTNCCTGFRIAENLVMTNFHCLSCVNKIFATLVKHSPIFIEPSQFLYAIPNKPKYREAAIATLKFSGIEVDEEKFYIPANDTEFKNLMNSYTDLFGNINFKNTIDNTNDLNESSIQIKEIMNMNLLLDYSILRVEGMDSSVKILKLQSSELAKNEKLAIMGHPSVGDHPNKKVYDITRSCKVLNPSYDASMQRRNVFSHGCTTAPGSSGSPIIDRETGRVVGLHWGANYDKEIQFGIEMKSIMEDLGMKWKEAI